MAGSTERVIRIVLAGDSAGAVRAFAETDAAATRTEGKLERMKTVGAGMSSVGRSMATMAVRLVALGAVSVKAAMGFQSSMEMIHTQAGASQAEVVRMSKSMQTLSPQVATGPSQLADSLYHVESAGFRGAQALNLVRTAAMAAKVGNASLADTTTALTAAVFSGIQGAKNYSQAMGLLNATVGAGDMKMQDLNEAFAGPMLATVKGYGLSLKDVGASLATFGDLNIKGAEAATQLRMAVQYMARPAATAGPLLARLGLNTNSFAQAMAHGGLMPALELLHHRLAAAGVQGNQMANVIGQLFTKRGAAGVTILENSLGKLQSKYGAVSAGTNKLGADFAATSHTAAFQFAKLKATADVALIGVGNAILPIVTRFLPMLAKGITTVAGIFTRLPGSVKTGIVAFLAIGGPILMFIGNLIGAIGALGDAWTLLAANPVVLIIGALVAAGVALAVLYTQCKTFRNIVNAVFNAVSQIVSSTVQFISQHWQLLLEILTFPFGGAIAFIVTHFNQIVSFFAGIVQAIGNVFAPIGPFIAGIFQTVVNGIIAGINMVIQAINTVIRGYDSLVGSVPFFGGSLKVGTIGTVGNVNLTGTGGRGTGGGQGGYRLSSRTTVGSQPGNAINQSGHGAHHAGGGNTPPIILHHTTRLGSRVVTEETVHYSSKRNSLGAAVLAH